MERKCGIIFLMALTSFAYNLSVIKANEASFINKCKAEDSKCIRESAQAAIPILAAGIPSLGVDTIDPMTIDKINAIYPNLKLFMDNIIITGLKDCVAANVSRDVIKSKILIELVCSLQINGNYDVSGHILNVPIEGKGKFKIISKINHINGDATIENIKKADGKTYWHVKDISHDFVLPDKATMDLDSLFEGNEELARAAREMVNSNTNELILEFGKPIIDNMADKAMKVIEQFYSAVPVENLALN